MTTIKQLAALAGVSPTTVTNVIHGRYHKVREETLRKVQRVIKETGYVPNMGGRLLNKCDSRLICVLITWSRRDEQNVAKDPFFGEIIGSLEREIRSHGYFMMLYISENAEECIRMAKSWQVDGLIVLGCMADDSAYFMRHTFIPLVFIDTYFHDDGLPYVNVGLEDRRGAYLITEYLIQKGHRSIAFLANNGKPPQGIDRERLTGYRDALREHGLPIDEDDYLLISHRADERRAFLRDFVHTRMKKYTALFFSSDFYAVDAIVTLYDEGVRVPEDISICGFDGNIFATQCRPQLTTVKQPVLGKAVCAVSMLLSLIRQETPSQRNTRLDVSLVIGNSVKDLRVP
ncbi:MAG: LacI family transcriptional regulator [Treponema sp.]|jgi:LacI family transcriptional regulator|nr:LacI family transcriptional regulator [Treponema sp.]